MLKCKTCSFFVPKKQNNKGVITVDPNLGLCYLNPPACVPSNQDDVRNTHYSVRPEVKLDDFCFSHDQVVPEGKK